MFGKGKRTKPVSQVLGALLKVEKDALSFETSNHQHRKVFNPRLSLKVAVRRWHYALSLERTDAGKISLKTTSSE